MLRTSWIALAALSLIFGSRSLLADEPKAAENSPKVGGASSKPAYGSTDTPAKPPAAAMTQEELEREFAETMSGSTLVGSFTSIKFGAAEENAEEEAGKEGAKNGKAPAPPKLKQDRYTLGKVAKLKDDLWLFESRIQYGDHDVTLPLTITVKWAGDTPVISLSDLTIPGLGTFSARILVYRDCYAGMWAHGDHGGQMFGRVVKAKKP